MDIKINRAKKKETEIDINDLVIIAGEEECDAYGIVIQQGNGYNVVVLDGTDDYPWDENLYLNNLVYITYEELQDKYTLVKKSNDYKLTIEL